MAVFESDLDCVEALVIVRGRVRRHAQRRGTFVEGQEASPWLRRHFHRDFISVEVERLGKLVRKLTSALSLQLQRQRLAKLGLAILDREFFNYFWVQLRLWLRLRLRFLHRCFRDVNLGKAFERWVWVRCTVDSFVAHKHEVPGGVSIVEVILIKENPFFS